MIDGHHHLWDLTRRRHAWLDATGLAPIRRSFTAADLAAATAGHDVEATVLVQALDETAESADILAIAERTDQIAGVVGWIDLRADRPPARLDALRALTGGGKLVGIRHGVQDEPDPHYLDDPAVRRGVAAVGAAGLVYDLLTRPDQLAAATRLVRALPDVRFVLDHLSKPPIAAGAIEPWRSDIRALAALPNVSCKLSGLATEADPTWSVADLAPYADVVLEDFGADRVFFGSDWPVCLLAGDYAKVLDAAVALTAGLSAAERAAVFGETARHVYALS
ncbi:MAG: amidohydrolase family protein [Mycobacteriales bacterium]